MWNVKAGDLVHISGDSKELWIKDYNVRVNTDGVVVVTPETNDKKVIVRLDTIDGDSHVNCYVRRSRIRRVDK